MTESGRRNYGSGMSQTEKNKPFLVPLVLELSRPNSQEQSGIRLAGKSGKAGKAGRCQSKAQSFNQTGRRSPEDGVQLWYLDLKECYMLENFSE